MSLKRKQISIWRILALSAIPIVLMLILSYRGWNARNRPPAVAGSWYLDDLRTDEDESALVTFSPTGEYDGDATFGVRWRYRDGRVFFRTWQVDDDSQTSQMLTNTTLYSWIVGADEFSLKAEFGEDGSVLTLVSEDDGPRCRLRRVAP